VKWICEVDATITVRQAVIVEGEYPADAYDKAIEACKGNWQVGDVKFEPDDENVDVATCREYREGSMDVPIATPIATDNRTDTMEFSESPKGYEARDKWARKYDELNGAPENEGDC
jgi:hypothetical protein